MPHYDLIRAAGSQQYSPLDPGYGIVGFNVSLNTLQIISETILRVRWPNQQRHITEGRLDPGAHDARCAWAVAVHHAVGISCQRNSGYKPSRVNIMAQGLSTPDPPLALHA